jgi:hypothetical protein
LLEKSHISVTSSPREVCVSLNGKLVHIINENTMLTQDVAYLTSRLERIKLSKKLIEEDLSRVDEYVTRSIYKLDLGYERCDPKGEISTKFVPSSTYKDEKETLKAKPIPYPTNPKPSFHPKKVQRQKQPTHPCLILMVFTLACFVAMRATWVSFAFDVRERRGALSILESHIMMSSLICRLILILMFRLTRTLVLCLALFHMLCLLPPMDLTIAHMVSVHERIALRLDALVTVHVLIVVIVSRVGLTFPLEGLTLTLSRDTWTAHIFSVVVHVPLG